ncbi:MAG TPA: L-2-amino-thiazoline-4-carboxylic acid hydrolase [Candidatus Aminicenantes bacterium]|nr:L-2-amino-thiazoline-4-carboxylic acid hydrolase [Acidobacteriota bacterium]HOI44845.1 L-2-amino-thiazoline-4-carboxylic acid hydrolase [Candidatus Aminicenantes bacterium]
MEKTKSVLHSSRRAFLQAALPGTAILCLGGRCLLNAYRFQETSAGTGQEHKFLQNSGMKFADVFKMAYAEYVPIWRGFEREMGSERFIVMLKSVIDKEAKAQSAAMAEKLGKSDFAAYFQDLRKPNPFWQHALTYEIVEDAPKAFEIKVTECLWAKTYGDAKAADLGYVLSCYGDFASAQGFNPKMRLVRTKTLMQGDEFCNHRYTLEE